MEEGRLDGKVTTWSDRGAVQKIESCTMGDCKALCESAGACQELGD